MSDEQISDQVFTEDAFDGPAFTTQGVIERATLANSKTKKKNGAAAQAAPVPTPEDHFKEWVKRNNEVWIADDNKQYLRVHALTKLARMAGLSIPYANAVYTTVDGKPAAVATAPAAAVIFAESDEHPNSTVAKAQTMALCIWFKQQLGPYLLDLGYEAISAYEMREALAYEQEFAKRTPQIVYAPPVGQPANTGFSGSAQISGTWQKPAQPPRDTTTKGFVQQPGCISPAQQGRLFKIAKTNNTLIKVREALKANNMKYEDIKPEDYNMFIAMAEGR